LVAARAMENFSVSARACSRPTSRYAEPGLTLTHKTPGIAPRPFVVVGDRFELPRPRGAASSEAYGKMVSR
jgi:hypothetical protein